MWSKKDFLSFAIWVRFFGTYQSQLFGVVADA
jgi:hypothetical protein